MCLRSDFGVTFFWFWGCDRHETFTLEGLGVFRALPLPMPAFFWQAPDQVDLYEVVETLARDVRLNPQRLDLNYYRSFIRSYSKTYS